MLRLQDIKKDYKVADTKVEALKGINISFRKNEFVSILGPSGCGKTTLLNLIGGLDTYTSGNLLINGKSTKDFKDKDWDVYRNHRVGFIFQSYNLIPHQTVLGNVELALTISGMNKAERVEKAKQALDKVGLSGQYYKRPNQLSGGQCQRVAIARSLVNDPEILLADEPTGALDTVTSVQIMELVKEIAKERLVIMVTHNPELAEKYSTRIVKLLDGNLQSDSRPFSENEEIAEVQADLAAQKKADEQKNAEIAQSKKGQVKTEKAKMSFWTAFKLSLRNLFSKKKRTVMTSIAGSIGIIGVSLVLSLSYGIQSYIKKMENDMLAGNPITITRSAFDINSMMSGMTTGDKAKVAKENGYIQVDSMIDELVKTAEQMNGMMIENDITADYVDYINAIPSKYVGATLMDYGIDITNNIYTKIYKDSVDTAGDNISLSTFSTMCSKILNKTSEELEDPSYADYAKYISMFESVFKQTPASENYIMDQYDLVTPESRYPKTKNEIMAVLNNDGTLSDLTLAQLGYYTQEEFINMLFEAGGSKHHNEDLPRKTKFSYDEILGRKFTWYPNNTVFENPSNLYTDPFRYKPVVDSSFTDGVELEIVGIITPKANNNYSSLSSGFYYTQELTEYILEKNFNSNVLNYLRAFKLDGFYGMSANVPEIDSQGKIVYILDEGGNKIPVLDENDEPVLDEEGNQVYEYNEVSKDLGIRFNTYSYKFLEKTYNLKDEYLGKSDAIMSIIGKFFGSTNADIQSVSLEQLGGSELPSSISIYPVNLSNKKEVLKYLDKWNSDESITLHQGTENEKILAASDRNTIKYTDMLSVIMSMLSTLINIVTIALVGFTALSLVVSCVMIAIITYVSVVERVKEIGVIRSLGGRKKDVSNLFTAETFIIGFASGAIGIIFTYIVSAIINVAIKGALGFAIAKFPIHYAVIMLGISVLLTLISGFIPSRSAAKKDPVVALRTE